jgi:hypothetical protein
MTRTDKTALLQKVVWDYNIPVAEVIDLLEGEQSMTGHLNRSKLFIRILESFPWFTITELFSPEQIRILLEPGVIRKLKSPALRKKYEFIFKRLQEIIPVTG